MTDENNIEYVVRDYSAVDTQVEEIARREKEKTRQLQIANLTKLVFLGLYIIAGVSLLILICGIAYRIAFPPKVEVIEKTEIVEKVVEPQPIIIQTPTGSTASKNSSLEASPKFFGKDAIVTNSFKSDTGSSGEESVIGERSVTTFTTIPSFLDNFGDVITGWKWDDINSKQPDREYCYINKFVGNDELRYQLATKTNGIVSEKSVNDVKSSGLRYGQLQDLISKCRWFTG